MQVAIGILIGLVAGGLGGQSRSVRSASRA